MCCISLRTKTNQQLLVSLFQSECCFVCHGARSLGAGSLPFLFHHQMENQTRVAMSVDGTDAPCMEFTSLAVRLRRQGDLGLWLVPQAQLSISCAGPGRRLLQNPAAANCSGSCKLFRKA